MQSTKNDLLSALKKIQGLPLLVVGDIILDRYIWGGVERISPEAPVPIVEVKRVEDRLGGASNVVRNLTRLGSRVSLTGFIGDDEEGRSVCALLDADSVNREGVLVDRSRPTILKTRVIAHSQQMLRIDREDRVVQDKEIEKKLAQLVSSQIESSRGVIISDYGKGVISPVLMKIFDGAQADGRLGLSSRPLVLDPHDRNFELYTRVTAAKPNRKEAQAASGVVIKSPEDAEKAAAVLLKKWNADMMIITLGDDGLVILQKGQKKALYMETVAREVFDVSGAGDTVTALFTAALAAGCTPVVAGDLANIGAGIVVSEVGTVAVTLDRLQNEIDLLLGDS